MKSSYSLISILFIVCFLHSFDLKSQKKLEDIQLVQLESTYFLPDGHLPIAFESTLSNGKKFISKPGDIASNRFIIEDPSLIWKNGYLLANLPVLYSQQTAVPISVGYRVGDKKFDFSYMLPSVTALELIYEKQVFPGTKLSPVVQLKFDNGAIWKIEPFGKDSAWAACFEVYSDDQLLQKQELNSPSLGPNIPLKFDYRVVWKPNTKMQSSMSCNLNLDVIYPFQFNATAGADGSHGRRDGDSGGHGQHGHNSAPVNIWLTLDSANHLLLVTIKSLEFQENRVLFAGKGKIHIQANGGKGGDGGNGSTGQDAAKDSGKNGDAGGRGGDGGDGGTGADVYIYYTSGCAPYLTQIEIENIGGQAGNYGKGGRGGNDDNKTGSGVQHAIDDRGPNGEAGRSGRQGQSGLLQFILIK